jgi:hypothetical protein
MSAEEPAAPRKITVGTAEAMASSPNRMYYGISHYVKFEKK